jgi:hypothetical protein
MWEPRPLTTLWAFTACYKDSFTLQDSPTDPSPEPRSPTKSGPLYCPSLRVFILRWCFSYAQRLRWRTIPCRISYYMYLQYPSYLESICSFRERMRHAVTRDLLNVETWFWCTNISFFYVVWNCTVLETDFVSNWKLFRCSRNSVLLWKQKIRYRVRGSPKFYALWFGSFQYFPSIPIPLNAFKNYLSSFTRWPLPLTISDLIFLYTLFYPHLTTKIFTFFRT